MTKKTKGDITVAGDKPEKAQKGQRIQREPLYKVNAGGVTIDFTDKIQEADSSFADAAAMPKEMWRLEHGTATLMRQRK